MDRTPLFQRAVSVLSFARKLNTHSDHPVIQAARTVVENLEARRLLAITLTNGELLVEGSLRKDNGISVDLSSDGKTYGVRVNSERQTLSAADVKAITIIGGRYDDYISVGKYVTLGTIIYPGWGNDTVIGGQGPDQVFELGGGNRIYTQGGDDYIVGGVGDDIVYGGYGQDVFFGNGGRDRFYGEFDNDYFDGSDKVNYAYGGPGTDTAVNASYMRDVENYVGSKTAAASSGTFRLSGSVLTVTGLQSHSNVFNIAYNSSNTYINITVGSATQSYRIGSISQIRIIGGSKNDLVQVSSSITLPFYIDVGAGNDTVYAGSGSDTIIGGDGDDRISGGKGHDLINGGNGNDTLLGDDGNDSVLGAAGNDRIYGLGGRDAIDAGAGTDYVDGGADTDTVRDAETKVRTEGTLTGTIGGSTGSSSGGSTGGSSGGSSGGSTGGSTGGSSGGSSGGSTGGSSGGSTGGSSGGSTGGSTGGSSGGVTSPGAPGGNNSSSGSGGGYTGGGNNGSTSAGGGIIDTVDTDANAPKPVVNIFALQTTIRAGQTVFVHGTNTKLNAGTPTTARYEWDFGDPDGEYNKLVGFNAAHTYQEPGTYKLTLRVINEKRGASEQTINITVLPAARRVIYVSASGSDSNDGSSTSKTIKTWARAVQLVAGQSDVEILFRRGDTYSAQNTLSITRNNVRLGAWGSGADPVIRWSGQRNGASMIFVGDGVIGSQIDDLTFDTIWSGPTGDRTGLPFAVKLNGYGNSVRGCTFLNVNYAVQTNGLPTGVLVQDCEAPSDYALRSYLVWGEGSQFVLLGNTVKNSVVEHAVRIGGVEHLNISYGDYRNPKIYDFETPKTALNIQNANYVTIYGNRLQNEQQIGPLGGADGLNSKHWRLTNVVIESNLLDGGYLNVRHGTEDVMIKNNIFKMNDDAQIILEGYNSEYGRGVSDVKIINNTGINTGTRGRFLYVGGSVDGIDLVNNLYKADNLLVGSYGASAITVVETNLNSFRTISNNVWPVPTVSRWVELNAEGGTGIMILGSYNRISNYFNIDEWNALSKVGTDYQQDTTLDNNFSPRSTQIAATNGAKYAGVFVDYYGKDRSLSESWAIGAIEI